MKRRDLIDAPTVKQPLKALSNSGFHDDKAWCEPRDRKSIDAASVLALRLRDTTAECCQCIGLFSREIQGGHLTLVAETCRNTYKRPITTSSLPAPVVSC